jgi:hypothetical protein
MFGANYFKVIVITHLQGRIVFSIVYLIYDELQFSNGAVRFAFRYGVWKGLMVFERSDVGEKWVGGLDLLGYITMLTLLERHARILVVCLLLAEGDFDIWVGVVFLRRLVKEFVN